MSKSQLQYIRCSEEYSPTKNSGKISPQLIINPPYTIHHIHDFCLKWTLPLSIWTENWSKSFNRKECPISSNWCPADSTYLPTYTYGIWHKVFLAYKLWGNKTKPKIPTTFLSNFFFLRNNVLPNHYRSQRSVRESDSESINLLYIARNLLLWFLLYMTSVFTDIP